MCLWLATGRRRQPERPREAGRACPMSLWALDPRIWHAVLFQSPFLRATQRRESRHTGSRLFQQVEQSCNASSGCMAAAVCWLLPPAGQQIVAGDGGGAGGGLCRQTACHPTSNLNARLILLVPATRGRRQWRRAVRNMDLLPALHLALGCRPHDLLLWDLGRPASRRRCRRRSRRRACCQLKDMSQHFPRMNTQPSGTGARRPASRGR